ncbi:MAG TPA: coenzyme F420-0:L-glutamate ligase [Nitrosopumilaceae archaeon]|nr:coenzyme F420-0:L-glutamate ligase [Nitrosopumilaceae archaeon]
MTIQIIPVQIDNDIQEHDDIVNLMLSSSSKPEIQDGDILIITQKIISKQEGSIVNLSQVMPSLLATGIASEYKKDPRIVQLILDQSKRIIRMNDGVIIVETPHGLVCANAGVDESNVKDGHVTILPKNADESAKKLQQEIQKKTGKNVAVIISDTFGRPFREGQTNCAIGISGISSITDYVGTKDTFGKILHVTAIAIADEICSAAELVMGKALQTPIAIVRNYKISNSKGSVNDLLRKRSVDLFR